MDGDGDDLESFRQRMGMVRESNEEGTSPEAIAARKELIHKNLFSRQIQREESVKELAQLLAISRGRNTTEMDEEMGSDAPSPRNETSEDSSSPIQEGEDNFSSEIPPGGDVLPKPSAPPLTQPDNIAIAIAATADTNSLERRSENATTAAAAATPEEGGFIRNLWKGITHGEQPSSQSQVTATTTPQCQLHQQHKLECSICLDEYKPNDTISWAKDGGDPPSASVALTANNSGVASGCEHIFHQGCLVSWLEQHDDCPLCRRKLVHEDADVRFSGAGWELGQ